MGKIGSIFMIGAVAVGGYLAYKYLKDPLGQLFGGISGGLGDIAGGAGDWISDFFGGISGALGLNGKPETPSGVYVKGEFYAPSITIEEQLEMVKEDLPTVIPLIEKAEAAGITVEPYGIRQMIRYAAAQQPSQARLAMVETEAEGMLLSYRALSGQLSPGEME